MANPSTLTVVGQFFNNVGDGSDAGSEPDDVPFKSGTCTLVPLLKEGQVQAGTPDPHVKVFSPVICSFDVDGKIVRAGTAGEVKVDDLTDAALTPHIGADSYTHRVEFRDVRDADGGRVASFDRLVRIAADTAAGGTVDLALHMTVAPAGRADAIYVGAPGGSDESFAAWIADDGSDTAAAVEARVAAVAETPSHLGLDAAEKLAAWLDMGAVSDFTLGVASDSTANDANDWPRVFLNMLIDRYPDIRFETKGGFDGTDYTYDVVLNEGSGTAPSGGTMLSDDFNRTTADLIGSTTSGGQVWGGAGGPWTADGSAALCSTTTGTLSYDVGSKSATATAVIDIVTSGTGSSQRIDLIVAASSANLATTRVYGYLSVNTAGAVSIGLYKVISGVSTSLGASFATGLTSDSATPQRCTLQLDLDGDDASLTITKDGGSPVVVSGTLAGGDAAVLGTYAGFGANGAPTGYRLDSIALAIPSYYKRLVLLNGAVAGTTLDYQRTHRATLYPDAVDVMIVSGGHNYSTQSASTYLTAVGEFVDDYVADHPESSILWSSQNPEMVGTGANPTEHKARQLAGRLYAREEGWTYLPCFEAFASQPDGGASLMHDDIHPNTPPVGTFDPGYGATLWASVLDAMIRRRSLI